METPGLQGARTFVEAHGSVAHGKWHVVADRVVFERDTGEFVDPAVISVHDLENSPTWRESDPGG
jgi:hypothetical protein